MIEFQKKRLLVRYKDLYTVSVKEKIGSDDRLSVFGHLDNLELVVQPPNSLVLFDNYLSN